MATLDFELERRKVIGDVVKPNFGNAAVRSVENLTIEVGDEWVFPENYTIMETKIAGTKSTAIYVFIEVNGEAKQFYPTTFTKSRGVVDENGEFTGVRKHTMGTAAELYRKFTTMEKAMNALKGKRCKVTNIEPIRTLRYGTTETQTTGIPTIDLIDDKGNVLPCPEVKPEE